MLTLFLLAMLNFRICLIYREELSVKLKVLCFSFTLYPRREKPIRPRDYSVRALQKKKRREEARRAREEAKKAKAKTKQKMGEPKKKEEKQSSRDVVGILTLIRDELKKTVPLFLNHLRIRIVSMRILVASEDPAKTGILYGAVCTAVSQLTEVLSHITHVRRARKSVWVSADFLPGKTSADVSLVFSIRVWQAVHVGLVAAMTYLKYKNKSSQKTEDLPKRVTKENGGTKNG